MEPGTEQGAFPRGTTSGGADRMREKASELTHTARERAMSTLDQQKGQVCELLDHVAESVENDRLGRHAAGYARRGSEFLRTRSADEIFDTVRAELRSRPGVLLSACFVAGLAIARVVRSAGGRDDGRREHEHEHESWRGAEWQGRPGWRGDEP